jgi:hypothetical protein
LKQLQLKENGMNKNKREIGCWFNFLHGQHATQKKKEKEKKSKLASNPTQPNHHTHAAKRGRGR